MLKTSEIKPGSLIKYVSSYEQLESIFIVIDHNQLVEEIVINMLKVRS